jgi:hypothetical protein
MAVITGPVMARAVRQIAVITGIGDQEFIDIDIDDDVIGCQKFSAEA